MCLFSLKPLAMHTGARKNNHGRVVFGFEAHGPAAIGENWVPGDMEVPTMKAARTALF